MSPSSDESSIGRRDILCSGGSALFSSLIAAQCQGCQCHYEGPHDVTFAGISRTAAHDIAPLTQLIFVWFSVTAIDQAKPVFAPQILEPICVSVKLFML